MAFEAIRGQDRAISVLRRALEGGRLARSYLFTGPSGCGRRMVALELAASVNCETGPLACGRCPSCLKVREGVHPDVHILSVPAGKREIVIKQVREVLEKASLKPFLGREAVFIVDGAGEMNEEASNTFLKTLEEPGEHARFILLARDRDAVLPTIASRCQLLPFRPLGRTLVEAILRERGIEPEKAAALALVSLGSMEEAFRAAEGSPASEVAEALSSLAESGAGDPGPALDLASRWGRNREEALERLELASRWYRDLMLLAAGGPEEEVIHRSLLPALRTQAGRLGWRRASDGLDRIDRCRDELEMNANVELTLDRLFLGLREEGIRSS